MFSFVLAVTLGSLRSKLNSVFFNLYLDRFLILSDMAFFGTFCIDDKSFFNCSLDRCHFYICYLFHYFYICCNVCCSLNDTDNSKNILFVTTYYGNIKVVRKICSELSNIQSRYLSEAFKSKNVILSQK